MNDGDLYCLLFENMTEGFALYEVITDSNGKAIDARILAANAAYEKHTGLKPQEVVGRTILEVMPQAKMSQVEPYLKVAQTGEPLTFDFFSASFQRHFRSKTFCPQPGQFATIVEDITKHKQAEQALRESETRFSSMFHVSPIGINIINIDTGRAVECNDAFLELTGYSREELINHTAAELNLFVNPEERQNWEQTLRTEGVVRNYPTVIRKKSGELRHVIASLATIESRDETLVITSMMDITELKRAEEELKLFKSIIESSSEAIAISDQDGQLVYLNPSHEKLFGRTLEQGRNTPYRDLYPQESIETLNTVVAPALERGESWEGELDAYNAKGELFPLWERADTLRKQDGSMLYAFGLMHDITERNQAEQALRESEEKYREFVSQAYDAFSLTDEHGVVIEWNQATEKLTGIPAREALGQFAWDMQIRISSPEKVTGEMRDQMRQRIEAVLKTGVGPILGTHEIKTRHANGQEVIVGQKLFAIRTAQGFRLGSIAYDLTAERQAQEKLKESEARYRSLFENMNEGFALHEIIQDENGRVVDFCIVDANPAYEQHTGQKLEEVIGHTMREVTPTADPAMIERHGEVALTGKPLEFEYYSKAFNRHIRVRSFRPQPNHFASIFEDITERKQTEQALRESEERFSTVFHSSPVAISISRLSDGTYVDVNEAFCSMFEISREEVIGHMAQELSLWVDMRQRDELIRTLVEQRQVTNFETQYKNRSGKSGFVLVSASIDEIRGEECALIFARDITLRKQAEQALREARDELELRVAERTAELSRSLERLDLATDAAKMGIWDWDIQKNELVWDKHMYALYGVKPQDFGGAYETWLGGIHPDDREASVRASEQARNGERPYDTEFRILWPDGSIHWLKADGQVFWDEQGKPLRMLGVNYDITARKQAEAQLVKTNATLEKALRVKDEFLAAISHELRTPLTGILGMTEALTMQTYGPLTDRQIKAMDTIESSGQRLLDLVTDILEYTSLESGNFPPSIGKCSLSEVCQSTLKAVRPLSVKKNQKTSFEMNPEEITLQTDARQVRQFLLHLLRNASKFTPEGGEFGVTVNGDRDNHLATITVWDAGIGIKDEELPKLFKPFVQVDTRLERQYEGTGLGLALVKQTSEQLGGEVSVTSVFGKGSRFTVTLPWKE